MQKHLAQQHPKRRLTEKMQHLDFCELTLIRLQQRLLAALNARTKDLDLRLHRKTPIHQIQILQNQVNLFRQTLQNLMLSQLSQKQNALMQAASTLDAISPLATLKRGYAIVTTSEKHVLRDANETKVGEGIHVKLMNGSMECVVEKVSNT